MTIFNFACVSLERYIKKCQNRILRIVGNLKLASMRGRWPITQITSATRVSVSFRFKFLRCLWENIYFFVMSKFVLNAHCLSIKHEISSSHLAFLLLFFFYYRSYHVKWPGECTDSFQIEPKLVGSLLWAENGWRLPLVLTYFGANRSMHLPA